MTRNEILDAAEKAFRHKKFGLAVSLLEPKVTLFTDNARYFSLLGRACYYKGDITGSEVYLKRAISCNPESVELRLSAAVTALRKRDTARAVGLWLQALDLDPDNKRAKRALILVRDVDTSIDLARFIRSKKLKKLLPAERFVAPGSVRWALAAVMVVAVVSLSIALVPGSDKAALSLLPKFKLFDKNARPINQEYLAGDIKKSDYIESQANARYPLTAAAAKKALADARAFFNDYRDNLAMRELNRIKYSNASPEVKRQAALLASTLKPPTFANIDGLFTYKDVAGDPYLYEGCYVNWRGRIKDVKIADNAITFLLMVGYDTAQVLEGTVKVNVGFETAIDPVLATEVLGRVVVNNDQNIYLEATSIHQLVKPVSAPSPVK